MKYSFEKVMLSTERVFNSTVLRQSIVGFKFFFIVFISFFWGGYLMADGMIAKSKDDKSKFEIILREDITIDRQPRDIWPHVLNREAWMSLPVKRLSGPLHQEGELVLVSQNNSKTVPDEYLLKTIRIVPDQQMVAKVFPKEGEDFLGFSDVSLREIDGKTRLTYSFYMELKLLQTGEAALQEITQINKGSIQKIKESLLNLKKVSETAKGSR